jgi:hypothetical protein
MELLHELDLSLLFPETVVVHVATRQRARDLSLSGQQPFRYIDPCDACDEQRAHRPDRDLHR